MNVELEDFNLVEKTPPHDTSLWGEVIAKIRNNKTGEIRDYHTDYYLGDKKEPFEFSDYWWSEGNASCDCNRGLFFGYSIGKDYDEIPHECGEGGFSVQIISKKNGKILYDEFEQSKYQNFNQ